MIAALICGRAENAPFPGRNTFPLLGRPLMVYPLLAAAHCRQVDRLFLTTDDVGMMQVGRHHSAEIIERPPELRAAETSLEEILLHGYRDIVRKTGSDLEMLVVLLANAPTVTGDLINQGIEMMRADPALDAVLTVSRQNAVAPPHALKLAGNGLLTSWLDLPRENFPDAYFPTALLWILRPLSFFARPSPAARPNEIVNTAAQRVAPLVHEGYGDVDFAWQIPAVEDWLRRHGFTEEKTPYGRPQSKTDGATDGEPRRARGKPRSFSTPVERRVLITTVPFCGVNRRALDLLDRSGIEYVVNPLGRRLKEAELQDMIRDFGILIAGTEPITANVLAAAPHLRLISRVGIGLDSVDLSEARDRGILVTYTPDAPAPAVADLTIGLIIALLRHISEADRQLRNGVWHRFMGRRLSELTVGVLGVGRVGKRVIQHLAGGFQGVRILANDLEPDLKFGMTHDIQWVEKEFLYQTSDVITIHLPLTPLTRHLITARELTQMKSSAVLINTARGPIVNEQDLAESLRSDRLAGAAIDVFEREPYAGELTTLNRCVLTCHMGSMSEDCRARMELESVEEVLRFLNGEPLRRIVPEFEYEWVGEK